MPSMGEGWAPYSHPGACVLHLYLDTHVVGILVPAVLLKRYHAVTNALSHLIEPLLIEPTCGANSPRSASLFRV